MVQNSTKADTDSMALFAGDAWFDPIEERTSPSSPSPISGAQ